MLLGQQTGAGIIYAPSRDKAERIAEQLVVEREASIALSRWA